LLLTSTRRPRCLDGPLEHLAASQGLDLAAAQWPIEEPELVEAPVEADPGRFPRDPPRFVARDGAGEVVAADDDRFRLSIDVDRHSRRLAAAVVGDRQVMPLAAGECLAGRDLDAAAAPLVDQVDSGLRLVPDHLEPPRLGGAIHLRNHATAWPAAR